MAKVTEHKQVSYELTYAEAKDILRREVANITGLTFEDVHFQTTSKDTVLFVSNSRKEIDLPT